VKIPSSWKRALSPERRAELEHAALVVGLTLAFRLWVESVEQRLGETADRTRGMVPADDLVTLGDLERLRGELVATMGPKPYDGGAVDPAPGGDEQV
jgi:hypothetical protein